MPEVVERPAEKADVAAREDLPDGADDVPGHEQRQREDDQGRGDRRPRLRHAERNQNAERHLDREDDQREDDVAAERSEEAAAEVGRGVEQLLVPADAVPEELVVAERVLHRIVHDRHQWHDGVEGHDRDDRQNEEPGAIVDRLVLWRGSLDAARRRRRRACAPDRHEAFA